MSRCFQPRRDPRKHFFPMPNEIFSMDLSAGEIAVYAYLMYRENRRSFQCWPSYDTIGKAPKMSKNTVRKYVRQLEEKGFIETEHTTVRTWRGERRNGKKYYSYLPKDVKKTVDELTALLAKNEGIAALYREWNKVNREKLELYREKMEPDLPLEDNKEFRKLKNMIIKAADSLPLPEPPAEHRAEASQHSRQKRSPCTRQRRMRKSSRRTKPGPPHSFGWNMSSAKTGAQRFMFPPTSRQP